MKACQYKACNLQRLYLSLPEISQGGNPDPSIPSQYSQSAWSFPPRRSTDSPDPSEIHLAIKKFEYMK